MSKRILVIGDSCRDVHVYCSSTRMCPDKPVPILQIVDQNDNPGMAKNVHRNIKTAIDDCDIVTNSNWYNITKTRYVHSSTNHMFFRLDSAEEMQRINLSDINYLYDYIVISDYDKGFLTALDIETISKNHTNVFLDTKKVLGAWTKYVKFIKINDHEFARSKSVITSEMAGKIIQTSGADGCYYLGENFPVERGDVIDVSGAGDSFLAGLVIEYSKNEDIRAAIKFANKCASKVVKHRGVSVI